MHDIADALSLNDGVRRNVVDSLLNYETHLHSGPTRDAADAERKRILEALPQIEQDRIDKLESDLAFTNKQLTQHKQARERLLWVLDECQVMVSKSRIEQALRDQ